MADIIKLRRDTAANWTSANPILAEGEKGIETDTHLEKVGDGITAWSSLPYSRVECLSETGQSQAQPMSQKAVTDKFNETTIYDISAAHSDTQYAGLSAALGTSRANIPQDVRRGGMAVKFINSVSGKYEQWNLKASLFSANESDWMSVMNPKAEDVNYESSNVKAELGKRQIVNDLLNELIICDSNNCFIAKLSSFIQIDENGNIITKSFDSTNVVVKVNGKGLSTNDYTNTDKAKVSEYNVDKTIPQGLNIEDANGNAILRLLSLLEVDKNGNIITKSFDSSQLTKLNLSLDEHEDDNFEVGDTNGNILLSILSGLTVDANGNVKTKGFNSANQISKDYIPFVVVDPNGKGDYITLADALANVRDTDSKHVTIYVRQGTYVMPPKVSYVAPYPENQRNLSIIGENLNKTILRNDIGFYDYTIGTDCTPLRLNGNVTIENLTIISGSSEYDNYYGTEGYVTTRTDRKASYCIHRDGTSNEGDVFEVRNCILIDDHMTTIGFGLKKNVTLRIVDCYLQSEQAATESGANSYGTLYGHFDANKKGLNQNLEVIRCQIVNKTSHQAINIMDAKASDATPSDTFANLKFVGNVCKTTNLANALVFQSTTEGYYEISDLSYGNNVNSMNSNN